MRTRRSPKNQDRLFKALGKETAPVKECRWLEDENGAWWTDCGNGYELLNGKPYDNMMRFCLYCGRPLKQNVYEEEGGST